MENLITTIVICYLATKGMIVQYEILKYNELQKRKKQHYKQTGKRLKQK